MRNPNWYSRKEKALLLEQSWLRKDFNQDDVDDDCDDDDDEDDDDHDNDENDDDDDDDGGDFGQLEQSTTNRWSSQLDQSRPVN